MPTINFPANPQVGDTYDFDSKRYKFDGIKWTTIKFSGPTAVSLMDEHKIGADQHPISGIAGLEQRLADIEQRKTTCLVNSTGTGAPHETVSAELPATIVGDRRYTLQNPFGINTPVLLTVEIKVNGSWCDPAFVLADGNFGYGVRATYKQGEGIIIKTGNTTSSLAVLDGQSGSGHQNPGSVTAAPCRVFVRRNDD